MNLSIYLITFLASFNQILASIVGLMMHLFHSAFMTNKVKAMFSNTLCHSDAGESHVPSVTRNTGETRPFQPSHICGAM